MNDFEQKFQEEWDACLKNKDDNICPTIMLVGISGAGKSSLINTVFARDVAETSDIKPETKGYGTLYRGRDFGNSVNLIDTAGYEMTAEGDTANDYLGSIKETVVNGLDGEKIHIIWYCISIANERFEEMDERLLCELSSIPEIRKRLCVVFTKCDHDTEDSSKANAFKDLIKDKVSSELKFFETCNDKELPLELPELIEWSADVLDDEDLRAKFIAAQMTDLEAKRKMASKRINIATGLAATAALTPIPLSDAAVLVPIQLTMAKSIVDVYGVANLAVLSNAVVMDIIISNLGRSIAGTIMKLLPGVGSVVGGVVNATVASSITKALGEAISYICFKNIDKFLRGDTVNWTNVFNSDILIKAFEFYKKNGDKNGKPAR